MTKPNAPINVMYDEPNVHQDNGGLTKREYFAAMAMQGILAKEGYPSQELGERSAAAADALITALNTNQ